jgi:3-oxoacyl-[acyl-carrier protein] reductase
MDLKLADRRFLVGGASRGLGAGVSRVLTAEGARVAGVSRDPDGSGTALPSGVVPIAANLSDRDGPAHAVQVCVAALGGLDGLVVNTGGPRAGRSRPWTKTRGASDRGHAPVHDPIDPRCPAVPARGRDPPIVIILSSVREPIPALITSNVLRPGLSGLIKSLVGEIAPIRINGVAPGRFDTDRVRSLDQARATASGLTVEEVQAQTRERIPLGRYGDPDELGRVVAFLLSPAASYLDGVILPVDGGMLRSLP